MTEWRKIPGIEGYEASDEGHIRRTTRGGRRYPSGYVLKAIAHPRGYFCASIHGDKKLIHRLVALAFHGLPPTPDHEVAHGDGTRTNNRADNLRWATPSENQADRIKHGTWRYAEDTPTAKLTAEQVAMIRAEYGAGGTPYRKGGTITMATLAKRHGVTMATISRAINGHAWRTQTA